MAPPEAIRRLSLRLLLLALAGSLSSGAAEALRPQTGAEGTVAELARLDDIVEPSLEKFEPAVRSRLERLRQRVEEIVDSDAALAEKGDALGQLGALYLLHDLFEPAQRLLERARRLQPTDVRWPYLQAVLHQFLGRTEEGLASARAALELRPADVPSHLRAGDFAFDLGDLDEATEHYRRALEGDPGSSAAKIGLGRVALRQRRWEEAERLLREGLEGQPPGSSAHHHLAMAHRGQGELEEAREHLEANRGERVIFPDPIYDALLAQNVSREAILSRGIQALRRGQAERALQSFLRVVELDPADAEAHYNAGISLIRLDRLAEAEAAMRRSIEIRPDYRDAHYNLGLILSTRGDEAAALGHFRRAAEIDPEDFNARVRTAYGLARTGRPDEARRILEEVLELDPSFLDAKLLLATLLLDAGAVERGVALLQEILDLAPGAVAERAEAHLRLARAELPGSSDEDALGHLRAAVTLDPENADAQRELGLRLGRLGRFEEAARHFERLVELSPGEPDAHMSRAMSYLLGGSDARARSALEASLEALSDPVALEHLLARLLATSERAEVRDGARALELAQRVLRREPRLEHAETLAMALAEAGRFEDAVGVQERVLEQERAVSGTSSPERVRRLELYRRGQPVRAPWTGGAPSP